MTCCSIQKKTRIVNNINKRKKNAKKTFSLAFCLFGEKRFSCCFFLRGKKGGVQTFFFLEMRMSMRMNMI